MSDTAPRAPSDHDHYIAIIVARYGVPAGRVSEFDVLHDDWCDLLCARGHCNCEPTITKRDYARRN